MKPVEKIWKRGLPAGVTSSSILHEHLWTLPYYCLIFLSHRLCQTATFDAFAMHVFSVWPFLDCRMGWWQMLWRKSNLIIFWDFFLWFCAKDSSAAPSNIEFATRELLWYVFFPCSNVGNPGHMEGAHNGASNTTIRCTKVTHHAGAILLQRSFCKRPKIRCH